MPLVRAFVVGGLALLYQVYVSSGLFHRRHGLEKSAEVRYRSRATLLNLKTGKDAPAQHVSGRSVLAASCRSIWEK
jgi:hypothetical protein